MPSHVDLSALPYEPKMDELSRLCSPQNNYRPEVWQDGRRFVFSVILWSSKYEETGLW